MTQAHTLVNSRTCVPPPLPAYLAQAYTLKTIIGVPADEDVKQIHDVIRAVNHLSNVPEMYDPNLSIQLSQFLFNAQLAVYRSQYPLNIFPTETTYTPPTIPSHIPISLESIVGAPSNEEVQSVRSAIRTVENLSNTPLPIDPILGTKLSQHLFNLQFARYLLDSTQGQLMPAQTQASSSEERPHIIPKDPTSETSTTNQQGAQEIILNEPSPHGASPSRQTEPKPEAANLAVSNQVTAPQLGDRIPELPASEPETCCQLSRVEELLKDIRRALVGTHNDLVRQSGNGRYYSVMNERGEVPWMNKLPYLTSSSTSKDYSTNAQIAGYLRCYGIGEDLFEEDGTDNLRPESEVAARNLLSTFLYNGYLPT